MNAESINVESISITTYIQTELDRKDISYSENRHHKINCLKNIGKSFNEYLPYENLLEEMDDSSIRELKDAINRVQFQRKSFTEFIPSSREEADKEETELRSKGYYTYGEFGGEYGYFKHKKKLTEEQKEWFVEHIECCYYHGQPCYVWQKEESDDWDEDCECRLGREYTTLVVYELDEDEEKRLDIWQQDIKWKLNGYGDNYNYYYCLDQLKEDALVECDHKLKEDNDKCPVCEKIQIYDGTDIFDEGNIKIKLFMNDNTEDY